MPRKSSPGKGPSVANTDPRAAGGDIVGPGGPEEQHSVLINTDKAVLLSYVEACIGHLKQEGKPADAVALLLGGKINQSPEQVRILFLMKPQGAADIVAHLLALADRAGHSAEFDELVAGSAAWSI